VINTGAPLPPEARGATDVAGVDVPDGDVGAVGATGTYSKRSQRGFMAVTATTDAGPFATPL